MTRDFAVYTHPERIYSIEELADILDRIHAYEFEEGCEAGVVMKQHRQLGETFKITSRDDAVQGIENPRTCEPYVHFFPKEHFESLREKLIE